MSLAQRYNAVRPVRFELITPRSQDKHSTTKPLRSQNNHSENNHKRVIEMYVNSFNLLVSAAEIRS